MGIFDASGNTLYAAYDANGNELVKAYDKDGVEIWSAAPIVIKVMQYNVGQWYDGGHDNVPADKDEAYYELQSGMIAAANADVLILEEYTAQFSKAGRTALSMLQANYPYYHEETNGTTTTVTQRAIFSKYPISNYSAHKYGSTGGNYYYDTCTITIDGVDILFAVTHMYYNSNGSTTERAREAQVLINAVSSAEYFVIGGDFNLLDCKSTSGADYQDVLKQFIDAGYHVANCADFGFLITYSDQPVGTWTGCLDEIVTSSNIALSNVYVDETKLSDQLTDKTDHMPLIATLTINR